MFDPYQSWLGIPRQEQPPHHYRLLGIAPFEADLAVIQAAAERQAKALQMQAVGPYVALAQQMCGEVAAARHCLLTAASKAAYDAQLASRMAKAPAPALPLPVAAAIPVAAPIQAAPAPPRAAPAPARPQFIPQMEPAAPAFNVSAGPKNTAQPATKTAPRPRPPAPGNATGGRSAFEIAKIVIGGMAGLMVAVLILNYFVGIDPLGWSISARKKEDSKTKKVADAKIKVPTRPGNAGNMGPNNPAPNYPQPVHSFPNLNNPPPHPGPVDPVRPGPIGPGNPNPGPTNNPTSNPPSNPPESVPDEEPRSLADLTKPGNQRSTGKKSPQPSADEQASKLAEVKDIYKTEFAAVKPGANPEFVHFLLTTARKVEGDPAARFVLMSEAFHQACAGGEIEKAAAALDELEAEFETEPFAPRFELLTKMSAVAKANDDRAVVARGALTLLDQATALGKFEEAEKLARIADTQTKIVVDKDLKVKAQAALQTTAELTRDWKSVQEAEEMLAERPENPAANLALGRYHCLIAGNWAKGLPHLAKSDDDEIKRAAALDAAGPSPDRTPGKIGDAWYELAKGGKGQNFYARADFWYQKSMQTETGLSQARSKKRREEIADLKLPVRAPGPGSGQPSGQAVWPTGKEMVSSGGSGEVPATDLLPLVNLARASPMQGWTKAEGSLTSPTAAQGIISFVETTFVPPRREYTLQARVTRTVDTDSKGKPAGGVIFGLTQKGKRFALIIDDHAPGSTTGRDRVAYLTMGGVSVDQNPSLVRYQEFKLRSDDVECNVASDRITVRINGNQILDYRQDMSLLAIPPGSSFTPAKPFFYAQQGGINVLDRWTIGPLAEQKSPPPGFAPNGPQSRQPNGQPGMPNDPSRPGSKVKLGPKR